MRKKLLTAALLLACAPMLQAQQNAEKQKVKSAKEIVDAAPASSWRSLDPANTLYMDLKSGRVIVELAPDFAPEHVANIKALARGGYWNGLSIYRSQDNFVVQFGDPTEDEKLRKPLPAGAKAKLPAEFERASAGLAFDALPDSDGWAPQVGFSQGFPAGRDPKSGKTWLAHCYGALGAGRDVAADSSNGTELYVATGQSPRALDRNITVVGRVVQGMELLSVIPRGPEPMGFYEKEAQRVPIVSIKLASEVPEAERATLQLLKTDSDAFKQATEARRNRRDEWYKHPAGHIDLCNVPLPVRAIPKKP